MVEVYGYRFFGHDFGIEYYSQGGFDSCDETRGKLEEVFDIFCKGKKGKAQGEIFRKQEGLIVTVEKYN